MSDEEDWRLKVQLTTAVDDDTGGALDHLLGHLRGGGGGTGEGGTGGSGLVHELGDAVPHDVVLTHDGKLLFAYAADAATLTATRRAIEGVLARENMRGSIFVSHWDEQLDTWLQTDPPLSSADAQREEAIERDEETVQTRTLVTSVGKMIRAEFEQSLLESAQQLGVQCTILEHPHLLTTQVGFTVTGPKRKLDEFSAGLKAEETATMRAERGVMWSQL
jgi:hypothetical protein